MVNGAYGRRFVQIAEAFGIPHEVLASPFGDPPDLNELRQTLASNGDISHVIQRHCEAAGFSVVRTLVGHGVGKHLHEEPAVPNFGPPGQGPVLEVGMVLAIEPMVNIGGPTVRTLEDGWTIVTQDGALSAHFEHTVAVQPFGPEILTVPSSALGEVAEG